MPVASFRRGVPCVLLCFVTARGAQDVNTNFEAASSRDLRGFFCHEGFEGLTAIEEIGADA